MDARKLMWVAATSAMLAVAGCGVRRDKDRADRPPTGDAGGGVQAKEPPVGDVGGKVQVVADTTTLTPKKDLSSGLTAERTALLQADPLGKEGQALAKALGDLTLGEGAHEAVPEDLRERINKAVDVIIQETAANTGEERMAARHQLERLWRLSADRLVENLDTPNLTIAEATSKTLILMRNERIVRAIMEKVKAAENERTKLLGIFTLGKMTEQRKTIVKNRECMSPAESARLARETIIPFLGELAETEKSERVRRAIARSLAELRQSCGKAERD